MVLGAVVWASIDRRNWNQVEKNNTDCSVVVDSQRVVVVAVADRQTGTVVG